MRVGGKNAGEIMNKGGSIMQRKILYLIVGVLAVVGGMGSVQAATLNGDVTVTAAVAAGKCIGINSSGTLDFGSFDPSVVAADVLPFSATDITFKCTNGVPYTVAVTLLGAMDDGSGHSLPYTLLAPVAGAGTGQGFSALKTITLTPDGFIAAADAQDAYNADPVNPLGYQEIVTVTITY